jgi:hypothetical protein
VVSFTLQLLYPQGKSPWYPLDRRLGGPESWSGHCREKYNLAPPGIEPRPSSPLLYQLSYPERKIMVARTEQCEPTFCWAMSPKITNNNKFIYNMYILTESCRE